MRSDGSSAEHNPGARIGCHGRSFGGNGDALFGPVSAGGEIGDRQGHGRRRKDGVRGRHAVEKPENLKLRFEFVGYAVDDEVGGADGILDGRDEGHCRQRLRVELLADGLAGMMEIRRHDVFDEDAVPGAGGAQGEPAAKRTRSDNGDCLGQPALFGGKSVGHVVGIGPGLLQVLSHAGALFGGKRGDRSEDAAQGDGDVVDIIHEADGFSGERHG